MADEFTRERFEWLNQVKSDTLPASAFKVAFEITQYVNREEYTATGRLLAWPSLQTMASGIAMSERTTRMMAKRLAAHGHLEIDVGHGPGNSSRYTLTLRNRRMTAALQDGKAAEDDMRTGRELPVKCGRPLPTNPLINTSDENYEEEYISSEFEKFWLAFPKRVGKHAARQIHRRILKTGKASAAEVLAGAERYADERRGQDQKFTKHPERWLKKGCWQDEPDEQRTQHAPAVEAALSYGDDEL